MPAKSETASINIEQTMTDVFSPARRSEIMAKIKSHGNESTELRLIKIFREFKISGWRRRSAIFGRPDFVFPKSRLAVFVDGCFWHGCPIHGSLPASNKIFWVQKLERNKIRDRLVVRHLKKKDWAVLRIWQHELRTPDIVARRVCQSLARCAKAD